MAKSSSVKNEIIPYKFELYVVNFRKEKEKHDTDCFIAMCPLCDIGLVGKF